MNPCSYCRISGHFLLAFLSSSVAFSQQTELSLHAYSGIFTYHGNGAAAVTTISDNPYTTPEKYTEMPYGRKPGFSYSIGATDQFLTKKKIILGASLSYETLTSKVDIDSATQNGIIFWQYSASGKTTVRNRYISLSPFGGRRYAWKKMFLDLTAGLDLAFCLESKESGSAVTSNDIPFTAENKLDKPAVDLRPRLQAKAGFKKTGVVLAYSLGLTNYEKTNDLKVYSGYLQLGFCYRLNYNSRQGKNLITKSQRINKGQNSIVFFVTALVVKQFIPPVSASKTHPAFFSTHQ